MGSAIPVVFAHDGFPRAQACLRERFAGTPFELVVFDRRRALVELVKDARVIIPSMGRIDRAVIDAAPHLQLIVQYGAGLDGVDREAAAARGIPVRNVVGANADAVAELALFLMLALARRLPEHAQSFRDRMVGHPAGLELRGRTLGVVGMGATGVAMARLGRGIGMRVIAVNRTLRPSEHAEWVRGLDALDALLAEADFVTLHLPGSAETRHLFDAPRLARMRRTAFLVNVGRGELVDREALVAALRAKTIAGAGLDVYWQEPIDPADELLSMPNVVATPHVGGPTEDALQRIADRVVAIIRETVKI